MKIDYPMAVLADASVQMPRFWVMEVPVISTAHFLQTDLGKLRPLFQDSDYGSCIVCIEDGPDDYTQPNETLSDAAIAVFAAFSELGYSYIRIDPDGDEIEGLTVHNW